MTKKEADFVRVVKEYYRRHGRRSLPWRKTHDPYAILVSEIMLQQTQVERVIPKYTKFLQQFPSIEMLARAPLGAVLREWQGLGYNRRAKMLHECAKHIVYECEGQFPREYDALMELPGIGPYTAGAVMAFAHNRAVPIIETNIRSVYLHHFFRDGTNVHDREIMECVKRTLDTKQPRTWYYALMDYGVEVKKMFGNPNQKSAHHVRQAPFRGSDREIRGAILKILAKGNTTRARLLKELAFLDLRIDAQLEALIHEGLVVNRGRQYSLPD
jgi:A/G-specific adenine glycosylase